MTDTREPKPSDGQPLEEDDEVRELLVMAGQRPEVPAVEFERIKTAARTEWKRLARVQSDSKVGSEDPAPSASPERASPDAQPASQGTARGAFRDLRSLAIAASLVLLAGVVWWVLGAGRRDMGPPAGLRIAEDLSAAYIEVLHGAVRLGDDLGQEGDRIPLNTVLRTASSETGAERPGVTVRLANGHSLRLDAGSEMRLLDEVTVHLDHGTIYVDSGSSSPDQDGVEIQTPFGQVTEIGTQFEVRVASNPEARLRVRVREGLVRVASGLDSTLPERTEVPHGRELQISNDRLLAWREIAADSEEWAWLTPLAPGIELSPGPLREVLEWFARERGLMLEFASAEAERLTDTTNISWFASQRPDDQELEKSLDPAVRELGFEVREGRLMVSADE